MVLLTSLLCFTADQLISYRLVSMILLISVSLLAMLFETFPSSIAILSALIWNFFFIPPIADFSHRTCGRPRHVYSLFHHRFPSMQF
ncbi:MAG: DUF4118 domain-containing protein [Bacteroidetes bacterium]|nr:DUF4118 domain-containing protein [Bacteroidota bacterium]